MCVDVLYCCRWPVIVVTSISTFSFQYIRSVHLLGFEQILTLDTMSLHITRQVVCHGFNVYSQPKDESIIRKYCTPIFLKTNISLLLFFTQSRNAFVILDPPLWVPPYYLAVGPTRTWCEKVDPKERWWTEPALVSQVTLVWCLLSIQKTKTMGIVA